MSKYTTFPNAPIMEAILDIKVQLPSEVTLEKIASYHDRIRDRFPVKEERTEFSAGIMFSAQKTSIDLPSVNKIGYMFRSHEDKKVVQSRLDGFAFNKLKPYESWEHFRTEGRELWNLYYDMVKPIKISRIALRYINRIEIPLPFKDFKDYVLTVPEIAPKLPQALSEFFMRLAIPNPDIGAMAVINETMEQPTEGQRLPFIFDSDVFKITNIVGNPESLWTEFEALRVFKNEIFFNSMTEKAKELFQ